MRTLLQTLAFFFPVPFNRWLHRLAGAKIGKHAVIHPCVLILARQVEIGSSAKIRFGTMVNVRAFKLGEKSLVGYFVHTKGMSDLIVGSACVIGPQTLINCDCPVILGYYSAIGPRSTLFTHGSFLPVTEGYRAIFGPIELKEKAWVTMNCTIGPGVTVGEGTNVMPGTVLLRSVKPHRLVAGNPAKLVNIQLFRSSQGAKLEDLVVEILERYCAWERDIHGAKVTMIGGILHVKHRGRTLTISVNGESDILLLMRPGEQRDGMFFNLADLTTDEGSHATKQRFEGFMRLHYGLTFLCTPTRQQSRSGGSR